MGVIPKLKLFKIEHGKALAYFDVKSLAMRARNQLMEGGASNIVVMRGPDHWRGESFNVPAHRPSQGRKRRRA